MKSIIKPSRLKGSIAAPASKSSMQRACAAALLRKGSSILRNPGHSADDRAALDIIQRLGAGVEKREGDYIIESRGVLPVQDEIHCGESGLSIRMFTPLVALSDKKIMIRGEGSLEKRPMAFFDDILPQLGVQVKTNNGFLPLEVQGPLQPADIEVDGSLSSQFLTGLLMAYAAADAKNVTIRVKNLKSKPYIGLTLDVMKQFGLKTPVNNQFESFYFPVGDSVPVAKEITYTVEGDWSGAAFLLVGGAIAGPVTVRGLDISSEQADKAILDLLMGINSGVAVDAKGITVHPGEMKGFTFDATDCPDLFPPLVALAAYCQGETSIKGVHRLASKESDRAATLQKEFAAMGLSISLHGDQMIIQGGHTLKGAETHSHGDHRIAMACAAAALGAEGETVIHQAEAVRKSYPDFFSDLQMLGADVTLPNKINLHE